MWNLSCHFTGLSVVTGDCDAGYYCAGGASRSDPTDGVTGDVCPLGRYCPAGTTSVQPQCPPGTFSNRTMLEAIEECLDCTPGYFCADWGLTSPTGPCDAGEICDLIWISKCREIIMQKYIFMFPENNSPCPGSISFFRLLLPCRSEYEQLHTLWSGLLLPSGKLRYDGLRVWHISGWSRTKWMQGVPCR